MPTTGEPSCVVIHCTGDRSDPRHEVRIQGGDELCPVPVCVVIMTESGRVNRGCGCHGSS
ncbi:MAG: hypothetical protein DLM61_15475 [Pseudonocardiales bacterium]|nr:MAG: hypothetical protein DLM61_15475 [Pseudonocardiales bacterium]